MRNSIWYIIKVHALRVLIRYNSRTFDNVYIYDMSKKEKVMLKKTDKIENGKIRRTEIIYLGIEHMEITVYYGMDSNSFIKDIKINDLYKSRDVGGFLSRPGMGKQHVLEICLWHSIQIDIRLGIYVWSQ